MSSTGSKRRRPGQACDSCHQKKTKCLYRPPSCVDCIRLGLRCTFDREPPESNHRTKSARLSRRVASVSSSRSAPPNSHGPKTSPDVPASSEKKGPVEQPVTLDGIEHGVQETIDQYFAPSNVVFPIISRKSFEQWMAEDPEANSTDAAARSVLLNSTIYTGRQHTQLTATQFNEAQRQESSRCMQAALGKVGKLLTSPPTIKAIQALVSFVSALQRLPDGAKKGLPVLAVAVRFVTVLKLHRLDQACDISLADRLERLRLFWCLYILDRETSLRLHVPPLLDDRDLFILTPRMYSDDSTGLVKSTTCDQFINLFAARQRLAQISAQIWKELYTFESEHQRPLQRDDAKNRLNCSLLGWKAQWFDFGDAEEVSENWPQEHLVSMVHLQFEYFYCLLKADPDTFPEVPKDLTMEADHSAFMQSLQRQVRERTAPWVDAARETLQLGMLVRRGGVGYLEYAAHYIVPAVLILSASILHNPKRAQAQVDRLRTKLWLSLFNEVVAERRVSNE